MMPRTACRVVCGFEDAMTIFWPTSALVSVDFPAFGLATRPAKPERNCADSVTRDDRVNVSTPVLRKDPQDVQFRGRFDACAAKRTQQRLSQLAHFEELAFGIHRPDWDARAGQIAQQVKIVIRGWATCPNPGFQAGSPR